MSSLPAKPGQRHTVPEWANNNLKLSSLAQHTRHTSNVIRQEGKLLCNETSCQTRWNESDTCCKLTNRIWDVSRWRETLELCGKKVDEEMEAMTLSKAVMEQALSATALPLEVSVECLTLREGRQGFELVSDPVEDELKKEVKLIEDMQRLLQQHVDRAFEQLCVLQELRHQITSDLQNKMEALDIDVSCLSLSTKSPEISLKINPTRIPTGSSTPEEWWRFSQQNVARAQEAMQLSQSMREDALLTRARLQNELETQRNATQFALRKRNYQEEQAHEELKWQIKNTEEEIADMSSHINKLDADLQAKMAFLKLAHTRLENRTYRPGMDLCRDKVQLGLVNEVNQLEATIRTLREKLSEARHFLQKSTLHHARMLQDLSRKQEALSLEQRSMKTLGRLALKCCNKAPAVPLVALANSSGRSKLKMLA